MSKPGSFLLSSSLWKNHLESHNGDNLPFMLQCFENMDKLPLRCFLQMSWFSFDSLKCHRVNPGQQNWLPVYFWLTFIRIVKPLVWSSRLWCANESNFDPKWVRENASGSHARGLKTRWSVVGSHPQRVRTEKTAFLICLLFRCSEGRQQLLTQQQVRTNDLLTDALTSETLSNQISATVNSRF